MKIIQAQSLLFIKPPLKKILKQPFVLYRYLGEVVEELWFLKKTKAPLNVVTSYILGQLKNQNLIKPYNHAQEKFREQKSSLKLTDDWFTKYIPYWLSVFNEYHLTDKKQIKALEVGSWEGLSSYFILHALPNASLTCVDTWEGADEHKSGHAASQNVLNNIESAFDKNLLPYENRLTKYKGTSFSYFNSHSKQNSFDLIYIDGSHHSDDVIVDAVKGFEMLKIGGVMIFDDYFWEYYPDAIDNPAGAINAFLKLKKGTYKIVRMYYQIIIEKTKDRR